jgi:hypothetical protein
VTGVAPQPGEFFLVGEALLDCVTTALAATAAGAPQRVSWYVGAEATWDSCDCGLLALHVPRTYQSETFPDQKLRPPFRMGQCTTPYTVAEYVVTVVRCVPSNNDQGDPPPAGAMALAMATDLDDRQAVLWGVQCCLAERLHMLGDQLAVGESGACAGSELHVFVPFSNCQGCPEGVF